MSGQVTEDTGWPRPDVFIQWKNTSACFDFHCVCGAKDDHADHLDADAPTPGFIRCPHCGQLYRLPDTLALEPVPEDALEGASAVDAEHDDDDDERA